MNLLVPRQPNIMDAFAAMDAEANRRDPGRPARIAEAKRLKALSDEAERQAVIHRYGSEEAALAGTWSERRLATAVAHMRLTVQKRYDNGTFLTDTLDGWTGDYLSKDKVPARVRAAVERAVPLPATIAEAEVEYRHWRARDRELELIHRTTLADTLLPLECELRERIVRDLLEFGLRATGLADVIVRQRYAVKMGREGCYGVVDVAVLADLEHLAAGGS